MFQDALNNLQFPTYLNLLHDTHLKFYTFLFIQILSYYFSLFIVELKRISNQYMEDAYTAARPKTIANFLPYRSAKIPQASDVKALPSIYEDPAIYLMVRSISRVYKSLQ